MKSSVRNLNVFLKKEIQESNLSSDQLSAYITDFLHLETTELARCEVPITEDVIWEVLTFGADKTPVINAFIYEFCSIYWHLSSTFG